MTSNRLLTPTLLCRQIVVMAGNLPWQMKLGVPFHCYGEWKIPMYDLSNCLDYVSERHLVPALAQAMKNRSEKMVDMTLAPESLGAKETWHGVTCRLLQGYDGRPLHDLMLLRIDLEFSSTSCDVPLYYWLGEQAEAA